MNEQEVYATFWDHVDALRRIFIRALWIIGCGVILSFIFYQEVVSFLSLPLNNSPSSTLQEERIEYFRMVNTTQSSQLYSVPQGIFFPLEIPNDVEKVSKEIYRIPPGQALIIAKSTPPFPLFVLGPLEGILMAFKISLWTGIVATSPFWLLIILQFVAPALRDKEKQLILPFLLTSILLIFLGCYFAFTVTIPLANSYLMSFNQSIGINLWSLSNYLDYTVFLVFASGLAFELGAIGIFAVHLKIVTLEILIDQRRAAIVSAFIIGAILSPPDVVTQFMLALPMLGLYEAVIIYAKFRKNQ